MIEEEETWSLTEKGKKMLRKFDFWYLKAWKAGHTECECEKIALSKLK